MLLVIETTIIGPGEPDFVDKARADWLLMTGFMRAMGFGRGDDLHGFHQDANGEYVDAHGFGAICLTCGASGCLGGVPDHACPVPPAYHFESSDEPYCVGDGLLWPCPVVQQRRKRMVN